MSKGEIEKILKWLKTDGTVFLTDIEKIEEYIDQIENENSKLNKMVDEMAEQLSGLTILDIKKDDYIVLGDKEEVKEYFEKKVEEK